MPIVLIDSCGFTYYRASASISWHKKSQCSASTSTKLESETVEKQCLKHLNRISTMLSVKLDEMFLIRDCPISEIWRRKHYPEYKSHRLNKNQDQSPVGNYIKHLNTVLQQHVRQVIRIPEAEADDVISILVQYFSDQEVIILANDSDYEQLCESNNVRIFNFKNMTWVKPNINSLQDKIIHGDKSDGVPPANTPEERLRNAQLVDLTYVPRYIQDRVVTEISKSHVQPWNKPLKIQLGLCCIHTKLRAQQNIFCSRTLRLSTLNDKGLEELYQRALKNCHDLIAMIKHIATTDGIRVLRISSDIFPHKNNHRTEHSYTLDFAKDLLSQAGKVARKYKVRLTFHPGQYNVVGTPDSDKFSQTRDDLDWQAEVLDLMGCDQDSVMVVHGGGLYGDKAQTIQRWIQQFHMLTKRVQRRLVLENCERCFNIEDCLQVSDATGIPVVFDTHHYDCYNLLHPTETLQSPEYYIPKILESWSKRHIKPKFHISEQRDGSRTGCHSDLIQEIPDYLLKLNNIDIMVEAKLKEQAIHQLYSTYKDLDPRVNSIAKPKMRKQIKSNLKSKSKSVPKPPRIRLKDQ